jgi:hypothetical protein
MNKNVFIIGLLSLILTGCNTAGDSSASKGSANKSASSNSPISNNSTSNAENSPAGNARLQAKNCVEAQYQADAAKFFECLHPEIVNSQGGKEKVLADLNQMFSMVGKISYSSLDVNTPKEVKASEKNFITVVPYQMTRKTSSGENKTSKDFLIGVSEDQGKTWKFATSAKYSPLEKKFPGVKDLKTPEVEF